MNTQENEILNQLAADYQACSVCVANDATHTINTPEDIMHVCRSCAAVYFMARSMMKFGDTGWGSDMIHAFSLGYVSAGHECKGQHTVINDALGDTKEMCTTCAHARFGLVNIKDGYADPKMVVKRITQLLTA